MCGEILFLVFSVLNLVSAFNETGPKGCNLVIPQNVREQPEPQPPSGPLLFHVVLRVARIRDISSSGGSFDVDLMRVNKVFKK